MQQRNQGFTLIEMIIVIAIIAILAAIAIPSFSNTITQAQAAACATNRRSAETSLQAGMLLYRFDASALDDEFQKLEISCPAHGTLHAKYDTETQKVSLECTKHTETLTQATLIKFKEMCKKFEDDKGRRNNDEVRNEMHDQLGGAWSSIRFDGDTDEYYIQPYWNAQSNEMYIFAGDSPDLTKKWNTGYIYNADDATWYHGKNITFHKPNEINGWADVWQIMQDAGWEPVDVEYEE